MLETLRACVRACVWVCIGVHHWALTCIASVQIQEGAADQAAAALGLKAALIKLHT